ncbi:zinc finger protein 436-like [Panonychus citri]|uniref:zinc finger protein 436-like n=1 Tax=Panonychus citri TaxID=50023 RepID=UPI002307EED7|nr:zinc finger protein 436-like [Panonychus citri]
MLDNLRSQREEGKFCDIVLNVGGKTFPAHRSVLAASSPYFESILKEVKLTKEEITIGWEDADSFEILLEYMYSGNITIDEKNVSGLLRLSNHFLITKLHGFCEQYLEQRELTYNEDDDDEEDEDDLVDDEDGDVIEEEIEDDNLKDQPTTDTNTDQEIVNTENPKKRRKVNKNKSSVDGGGGHSNVISKEIKLETSETGPSRKRKVKSKFNSEEWITSEASSASRKVSTTATTVTKSGEQTDEDEMFDLNESSNDQRPAGQTASLAQWREGIKCPHCSYIGHSATRLEQHLSRVHEEDTTYKCRLCEFTCKWNREYYKHMKCHFDGPPYKCEDCDYTCDRIQFILSHRMRHTDERPFNCEMCPFKSRTKGNLIVHMRIHTGEKPYKCQFCDRGFAMKNTLDQHLATHREDRPFLCDTCGFTTKYQSHLLSHRRIHTGNVFHCNHEGCNYFSPRRSQLAAHERSHSSVRSHICVTCGQGFIERSHLVRHERIHLEDKPFKCTKCDYESTRRDKLKEHVLKHHSGDSKSPAPYKPRKSRRQSQVNVVEESAIPEISNDQLIVTSSSGDQIQIAASEQEVATANLIYEYTTDGVTPTTIKTLVIQNIDGEGDSCYLQLKTTK